MSTRRILDLIFDVTQRQLVSSENVVLKSALYPYMYYKEVPLINLQLVTGYDEDSGTFTPYSQLDGTLTFQAVIDKDFNTATDALVTTLDADFNVDGEYGGGNADVNAGQLSFPLDGFNSNYLTRISTSEELSGTMLEIVALNGDAEVQAVFRFDFRCLGLIGVSAESPPDPVSDYYTSTETDAKYPSKVPADGNYRFYESGSSKVFQLYNATTGKYHDLWLEGADGAADLKWAMNGVD